MEVEVCVGIDDHLPSIATLPGHRVAFVGSCVDITSE